jgi:hypothetical protein
MALACFFFIVISLERNWSEAPTTPDSNIGGG